MNIYDFPMKCCGMVQASGFFKWPNEGYGYHPEFVRPELEAQFKELLEWQEKYKRNCAMITLSDQQTIAIEIALKAGFKKIYSFNNPNSLREIGIYVRVLWQNKADFNKMYDRRIEEGKEIIIDAQYNGYNVDGTVRENF